MDRVEVLKGPQGTLYGGGAVSGTIRFITTAPRLDEFSGKGGASVLFTEDGQPSQRASAVLNVPVVTDVFGIRAAATLDRVSVTDRSITLHRLNSDEISLVNARIGAAWDRWSLQLFGENLSNERGSFEPWIFWAHDVRNRPRSYGLKAEFSF